MSQKRTSRRTHTTARDYPRTARLNELVREILADELERLDDDRLDLLTIISVVVEPDLRHAVVYYDCLDGEAGDEAAQAALGEARVRLQSAIARQSRTKRTPELSFRPDPSVRSGARIDEILRDIGPPEDEPEEEPEHGPEDGPDASAGTPDDHAGDADGGASA
jgi:ribosome-binding factor A